MRRAHAIVLMLAGVVAGCGRDSQQTNCDNLLPAAETSYIALAQIVTDTNDARNCAACHYGSAPVAGLNLESAASSYFPLRDRFDTIYAQIASQDMPPLEEGDGTAWSEADLRLLRSWYCRGAFYD